MHRVDVTLALNTVVTVLTPPMGHKYEIVGWAIAGDSSTAQLMGSAIDFGGSPGLLIAEDSVPAGKLSWMHDELSLVVNAGEDYQLYVFGGSAGPFKGCVWYVDVAPA